MRQGSSPPRAETGAADPTIQQLADDDRVPWWKKKNLRYLYLMLVPTCMGVELTSGFDSQMINALQIVPAWKSCKLALFGRLVKQWHGVTNGFFPFFLLSTRL